VGAPARTPRREKCTVTLSPSTDLMKARAHSPRRVFDPLNRPKNMPVDPVLPKAAPRSFTTNQRAVRRRPDVVHDVIRGLEIPVVDDHHQDDEPAESGCRRTGWRSRPTGPHSSCVLQRNRGRGCSVACRSAPASSRQVVRRGWCNRPPRGSRRGNFRLGSTPSLALHSRPFESRTSKPCWRRWCPRKRTRTDRAIGLALDPPGPWSRSRCARSPVRSRARPVAQPLGRPRPSIACETRSRSGNRQRDHAAISHARTRA
jgi:hypothetical protein